MKKYEVIRYCWKMVEIEAENEKEAIQKSEIKFLDADYMGCNDQILGTIDENGDIIFK